jgi:hypothetical protein
VKFVATKKGMTTNLFHPSLLLLFLDLGKVKIRIRDKHSGSATLIYLFYTFKKSGPPFFLPGFALANHKKVSLKGLSIPITNMRKWYMVREDLITY